MRNGEVVIIDEFTGRMMPGRRYSEGLHQALEAKEHQPIQPENQTLASITFQNYFRMYEKLAGMTGTALTEADEFLDIYNLEVLEVPTNMPMIRLDDDDEVYRTGGREIPRDHHADRGLQDARPAGAGRHHLDREVGAASPRCCARQGWEQHDFTDPNAFAALYCGDEGATKTKVFAILNARYHEQEAYIISQAGRAGRDHHRHQHGRPRHRHPARRQCRHAHPPGARRHRGGARARARPARRRDPRPGRPPQGEGACGAGGLFVLGTERHESRRIDNQLRGRSGRQGDPGHSKFFLALEDDLMRIFGSDQLDGMLQKLGLKEDEAIVHPWINKALEKAQQKVEARNFDIRKNLLKFDNVMNDQRKVIFEQRVEWMRDETTAEIVADMRHTVLDALVAKHIPENAYPEQWDTAGLKEELNRVLGLDLPVDEWAKEEGIADEEIFARVERRADEHMAAKVAQWGPDVIRYVEKSILLQTLDHLWREHLVMLEHLRQVIGLRGYGQRDPLNEYKAEAFNLFEAMSQSLREAVTAQLMRVEILQGAPPPEDEANLPYMEAHKFDPITGEDEMAFAGAETLARHGIGPGAGPAAARAPQMPARNPQDPASWGKVGRNEACPCGSGKKFKHCHGRYAAGRR